MQYSLIFISLICFFFLGMSTNEDVQIQRSEQRLRSVSLEAFYEPHYVQKRETNDDKKALTAKKKQYIEKVGGETKNDTFIKVPCQYKP